MKRETASAVDSRMAKALAHPLRVQLLAALNEGVASPNELAKKLDEPLTNVSYHVRMLHDLWMLEPTNQEPRRGALEHYYRQTRLGYQARRTADQMRKLKVT